MGLDFNLKIPETRRLFEYWRSLQRDDCLVPDRARFDPAAITDILSLILLMQRESADMLRLKIMGTRVVERMGRDLTGINFLDVFGPNGRDDRREVFNAILDRPALLVFENVIRVKSGGTIPSEGIFLPLSVDGEPRQIVGVVCRTNSRKDRQYKGDTIVDVADVPRFDLHELPVPAAETGEEAGRLA